MRVSSYCTLLLAVLVCGSAATISAEQTQNKAVSEAQRLEARKVVKQFATGLQSTLQAAMQKGGPIEAINSCNLQAAPIAQQTAQNTGWTVARTTLKVRNSANNPDSWELDALLLFERQLMKGATFEAMEFAEVVDIKGKPVLRYMKAIPTTALCLNCHGPNISSDVSQKLKELYPYDQATGFNAGEIRGAFTLQKPLSF